MVEESTRVDRLVSIDVVERFEALQDEVDLMKNEIKQTLIDLREHMMKGRTVFAQPELETQYRAPSPLSSRATPAKEPPVAAAIIPANRRRLSASPAPMAAAPLVDGMNPLMMGSIISWLGTVKDRGISLQQVTPFLEAYEASGYLSSIMLKVLLRSLADLDQMTGTSSEEGFSPEKYSECIGELHEIICSADTEHDQASNFAESYSEYETEPATGISEPVDSESAESMEGYATRDLNGHELDNGVDPAANGYNLTTIRVPDSEEEDLDDSEDGGRNG